MRILIIAAILALAAPASAKSITCVYGTIKYIDKPNSVTVTCDAPKKARRTKSAYLPD